MPQLVRLFLKHGVIGAAFGWAVLALCLVFDVWGLGGFVARSTSPYVALYALALSFGPLFGAIAISLAVIRLTRFDEPPSNSRLERWRKGGSAELRQDRPLP